tara:strand:+ start:37770 stop:38582 length:813 start_codon:yes stop_codon:yes gene_type:complete
MLSIICPCYNSETHIVRLSDSLLSQIETTKPYEIIFIDDGSSDRTLELLHSHSILFKNKNIDIKIITQSHKGPGSARNLGIKNSKYEYIAFIDSDDIWYKNKINETINIITKYGNEYNTFVHDEIYKKSNGESLKITSGILISQNVSESLYKRNCLSTSATIISKKILVDTGGFDESLMSSQDYDLWLKISSKMKLYKINKVLGEYIESENSITSKYYLYRCFDQLKIAIRYKNFVNFHIFFIKVLKIIFSKQWIYGLSNIFTNKKGHNY